MQEQALVAGFALGVNSLTSENRLRDFVKSEGQTFFDEKTTERIKDIIVIDEEWQVYDSLNDDYLPTTSENDETVYQNLKDLKNLPPLMEGEDRLGEDAKKFPNPPDPQLKRKPTLRTAKRTLSRLKRIRDAGM